MQLLDRLRDRIDTKSDRSKSATIPPSDCYSLLSNERRRLIIAHLADFDIGEEIECGALADHLATLGDDRQAAYISIIQHQCMCLEKHGIVEYDDRKKTLTPRQELQTVHDAHQAVENVLD